MNLDRLTCLSLDVAALVDTSTRDEWIHPDRRDPETADNPKLARSRAGGFGWQSHAIAMLDDLALLRDGYTPPSSSGGGRSQPDSRLPGGSDVADLLAEITTGAADLHWKALRKLGRIKEAERYETLDLVGLTFTHPTAPRQPIWCLTDRQVRAACDRYGQPASVHTGDARGPFAGYELGSTAASLRALVELAPSVDDDLAKRICDQVHRWALAARLTLSHVAPMAKLQAVCPLCERQSLIVRSDASGDVHCTTEDCINPETGQPTRWPRHRWPLLLGLGASAEIDDEQETA